MTEAQASVSRFNETYDAQLLLWPASTAAVAATTVNGTPLDLGNGEWWGQLIIDVSSITVASTHTYTIALQGAVTNFATIRELACLRIGDTAAWGETFGDSTVGRYKLPCCNFKGQDGPFRYVRLVCTAAVGTIDFTAFLATLN